MQPYSVRNKPAPAKLRYDVPQEVRARILFAVTPLLRASGHGYDHRDLYEELLPRLLQQYGQLAGSDVQHPLLLNIHPVELHYQYCDTDQFLDLLEFTFRLRCYRPLKGKGVDAINAIFRECGIGYELTHWHEYPDRIDAFRGPQVRIEYPQVVKLDHLHQHEAVIRPCLELLSDPRFQTANSEMLKSHEDYRHGRHEDAITACAAAFGVPHE